MSCTNVSGISDYMQKLLDNYNEVRGKVDKSQKLFWDAVIISACDISQKNSYEIQISSKQNRGELPINIPFLVFSDPPEFKIGCGGSTMFVLQKLFEIYGNSMFNMRFLLIPAGGYSQRLPNLSVLGKLFSPLPFGRNLYQMLDLILATYLPFLKKMNPGVFLASSDAIISYSMAEDDIWTFQNEGFTALAHPSPVMIGTTHGVYVLPLNENIESGSTFMSECLHVLQKPSVADMQEMNAITKNYSCDGKQDDVVFSDSAFFFDHQISVKLINFYKSVQPLKCELSSYGDFLQPLGLLANPSYIVKDDTNQDLATVRAALYANLFGTKLSVLVLKDSNFHHLGTMEEYVASFCFKNMFSLDFRLSRFSYSSYTVDGIPPHYIHGTLLHSRIHPLSTIPDSALLEYCDINTAVVVGENSIISNVKLNGCSVQKLSFQIPDNTLLHTVPFKDGFVTIACSIYDDIKETFAFKDCLEVQFFRRKLKTIVVSGSKFFESNAKCSLWNAQLFPLCNSSEESVKKTLEIVLYVHQPENLLQSMISNEKNITWISMNDILLLKDSKKMINYQNELHDKISVSYL